MEDEFRRLQRLIAEGDLYEYSNAIKTVSDINIADSSGITLLMTATGKCNFAAVVTTLEYGAKFDVADNKGSTALIVSIRKGFLHIASLLLRTGADPNKCDNGQRPPLYFAITRGDFSAVRLLLDFGADAKTCFVVGDQREAISSITTAVKCGFPVIVKLLRDCGAGLAGPGESPLQAAIDRGSRESLTALIDGNEACLLGDIGDMSVIRAAITRKSTLLSVIVGVAKQCAERTNAPFPPRDVKGGMLKKMNKALRLQDNYLPRTVIKMEAEAVKNAWLPNMFEEDVVEASVIHESVSDNSVLQGAAGQPERDPEASVIRDPPAAVNRERPFERAPVAARARVPVPA